MSPFYQHHKDQFNEPIPIQASLIINIGTITVFCVFSFYFLKLREKNYGLIMILILSLSDISYPLMDILTAIWVKNRLSITVLGPIAFSITGFNYYWIAAFALYTYSLLNSIKRSKIFHHKRFISIALVVCLMLSSAFPLSVALGVWRGKISLKASGEYSVSYHLASPDPYLRWSVYILRDGFGKILPLSATSFLYWRIYKSLKKAATFLSTAKDSTLRLFWLSIIPLACSLPGIFIDAFSLLQNDIMLTSVLMILSVVMRNIWGFLYLLVYWKLQNDNRRGSFLDESFLMDSFSEDNNESIIHDSILKNNSL